MDPAFLAAPASPGPRFVILEDGCFRDTSILVRNEEGAWVHREYTPTLNPDNKRPHAECLELAISCTLSGGGWQAASADELNQLVDRTRYNPALPTDPALKGIKPHWHWTRDNHVEWSELAWYVNLHDGLVGGNDRDGSGDVLGCRLAPASQ
jgi:hypothetical protein